MKLPEYLLSTPRFICVLFTLACIYGFVVQIIDWKDFLGLVGLAFGYLFGARWSEQSPAPSPNTSIKTTTETVSAPTNGQ